MYKINIMRAVITLLTCVFITITGFSQHVIEWEKSFGGSGLDGAEQISSISFERTSDGGYIVASFSNSDDGDVTGNQGLFDFLILKLSPEGTLEWQKSLGGSLDDLAYSIQQTSDGGYIVAGDSRSNDGDVTGNHGGTDIWVVKLNATGSIEWQKSLGGSLDDYSPSIQQTSDGGYIVAGSSRSSDGDLTENKGGSDYWIVKLSPNGNMEWQKSLGGSSDDDAYSIKQTPDGGYIVAGDSSSKDGDVTGNHGGTDIWVVKLDGSGNLEWERSFGGWGSEQAADIQLTTDGGYIVAGLSNFKDGDVSEHFGSYDYWIVKLTSTGLIEWEKSYGGSSSDSANSIRQTTEGGYIIAGTSGSGDGDVTGNNGGSDYWIVKINATGALEWQKSLGGSGRDEGFTALQISDDNYIMAGFTFSDDGDVTVNKGLSDIWIVELTPFLGVDDNDLNSSISLYPNPNNGQFYLNLSSLKEASAISIIDVLGRLVYTDKNVAPGTVEINQNFASGMYVVTVSSGTSEINLKMIVK